VSATAPAHAETAKAVNLLLTNPGTLMDYIDVPVGQARALVHQRRAQASRAAGALPPRQPRL
jgi:hypothetical protein